MSSTVALPSPADEYHPEFGGYIYSPTCASWTQRRAFLDGRPLLLCGNGRSPTSAQIALFHEIDSRLAELTRIATDAIGPPPIEPQLLSASPEFRASELRLREVDVDKGSSKFLFFFDTPVGDKIHLWPIVTFEEWRVKEAEWAA